MTFKHSENAVPQLAGTYEYSNGIFDEISRCQAPNVG